MHVKSHGQITWNYKKLASVRKRNTAHKKREDRKCGSTLGCKQLRVNNQGSDRIP